MLNSNEKSFIPKDDNITKKDSGNQGVRDIEKEKNPIIKLFSELDNIATGMKEKGLKKDATIVEKIEDRFNRYAKELRERKAGYEEKLGRKISYLELRGAPSGYIIGEGIPVTHEIGENGGWTYGPTGSRLRWFEGEGLEKYKDNIKNHVNLGAEVVNFSFSKEGELDFYRKLGILKENEDLNDIPKNWEKFMRDSIKKEGQSQYGHEWCIDPRKYESFFNTNIEGVRLIIRKSSIENNYGKSRIEDEIRMEFDNNFRDAIIENKQI